MTKGFRPWQAEFFELAYNNRRCYLIAPPGQGKSIAGQSFAMLWAERGRKVLIITPRNLILDSFKGNKTLWWDSEGKTESENLIGHTFKYNHPLDVGIGLDYWLLDKYNREYPYFISTHQGLLAALKKNQKQGLPDFTHEDLAVVIDEAHLLSDSEDSKLGQFLRDLIAKNVPVLVMTGTPYRGDDHPIIPKDLEGSFKVYTREFYEALDEASHLQGFQTKVVVGKTLNILRDILSKLKDEDRYAVIKLPRVSSNHSSRLARELGIDLTDPEQTSLKLYFDEEIIKICESLDLSYISVVKDDSNDENLKQILNSVRFEDDPVKVAKILPRVVLTQDKIGLGVDCPWWTDSIMLGASKSCTETVQFGMRSCRDHKSKINKCAIYWTLIPEYWEPDITADQALAFAKDLVSTQLWWYFIGGGVVVPYLSSPHSVSSSDVDRKSRVPPNPKEIVDASLAIALNHSFFAGDTIPTIPEEYLPVVSIDMHTKDGTKETIKVGGRLGDGNYIHPMSTVRLPGEVVTTGSFLSQLLNLAQAIVMKGEGKQFNSFIKEYQITPEYIISEYNSGKKVRDIHLQTGWTGYDIEKLLKSKDLIKSKLTSRKRARGHKEED
jgi:hypothetical protein